MGNKPFIIETWHDRNRKDSAELLEEALQEVKDKKYSEVIIILANGPNYEVRWSGTEDKMRLGGQLIHAGLMRMGIRSYDRD